MGRAVVIEGLGGVDGRATLPEVWIGGGVTSGDIEVGSVPVWASSVLGTGGRSGAAMMKQGGSLEGFGNRRRGGSGRLAVAAMVSWSGPRDGVGGGAEDVIDGPEHQDQDEGDGEH